jgi:hypothetical protein
MDLLDQRLKRIPVYFTMVAKNTTIGGQKLIKKRKNLAFCSLLYKIFQSIVKKRLPSETE